VVGGTLDSLTERLKNLYYEAEADNKNKNLFISTGINAINAHCGGLCHKDLVGVLGFVANRKTCMARTVGLNAVCAGYAARRGGSTTTIRSWFEGEPGCLIESHSEKCHKRGYKSVRIPQSVADRVYARHMSR